MEILVLGFRPHILQSLLGDGQILGVTQSTTWKEHGISKTNNVEANSLAHIAAIREVGVFPASLMPLTNSHCSLPPYLTAIL